jgi:hypothetical protein
MCTLELKKFRIIILRTYMFLSSNSRFNLKAIQLPPHPPKKCIHHPDITCANVRSAMYKENDCLYPSVKFQLRNATTFVILTVGT